MFNNDCVLDTIRSTTLHALVWTVFTAIRGASSAKHAFVSKSPVENTAGLALLAPRMYEVKCGRGPGLSFINLMFSSFELSTINTITTKPPPCPIPMEYQSFWVTFQNCLK